MSVGKFSVSTSASLLLIHSTAKLTYATIKLRFSPFYLPRSLLYWTTNTTQMCPRHSWCTLACKGCAWEGICHLALQTTRIMHHWTPPVPIQREMVDYSVTSVPCCSQISSIKQGLSDSIISKARSSKRFQTWVTLHTWHKDRESSSTVGVQLPGLRVNMTSQLWPRHHGLAGGSGVRAQQGCCPQALPGGWERERPLSHQPCLHAWLPTTLQTAPHMPVGLQCSEQNHMCQETLVHTAVIQQRGGDIWKTVGLKELWVTLERKHGIYCHMGEEKRSHVISSSLKVGIMTQWENNNIYTCTKDTLHVSTCSSRHLLGNKVVASEDATAIISLPNPCARCYNTTLIAQSAEKDAHWCNCFSSSQSGLCAKLPSLLA